MKVKSKMKKILKSDLLLYPCPVLLVTSKYNDIENVFTVSWAGIACSHPEYIMISVKPTRFSYDLIRKSGYFAVNIINEDLLGVADYCGKFSGKEHDKFKECNLTKINGKKIDVPLVSECPINIECEVENVLELGSHHLIVGRVVEKLIDASISETDINRYLKPVSYIRPNYYSIDEKSLGTFGGMCDVIQRNNTNRTFGLQMSAEEKMMAFFDEDDLEAKYQILLTMREDVTNTMIDNMAVVLDVVIEDGPIANRFDDLKRAIQTKQRYEQINRLR